jgi:hypothetical protein
MIEYFKQVILTLITESARFGLDGLKQARCHRNFVFCQCLYVILLKHLNHDLRSLLKSHDPLPMQLLQGTDLQLSVKFLFKELFKPKDYLYLLLITVY